MEKLSLFEIDEQILKLISLDESEILDEETGEVLIDVYDELEKLNMKREEKIINIARYLDDLEREKNLIKQKADILSARVKSKEKQVDRLKAYLTDSMVKLGTNKIEDEVVSVRLNSSKSVNVIDEKQIPEEYIRTKIAVEPDKCRILAELKKGTRITGVELAEKYSVVVR